MTIDVGECVDLASPEERFACYERRVEAARSSSAGSTPAGPTDTAPQPQAAQGPTSEPQPRRVANPPAVEAPAEPTEAREYFGTVAALRETVPNSFVITLDDGQVWRQTRPKWYPLRPGQRVRIYPTRLWGYRLSVDELNGFIQVQRVR